MNLLAANTSLRIPLYGIFVVSFVVFVAVVFVVVVVVVFMSLLWPCLLLLVTLYFVVLYVNLRLMEAAVEFLPIPYSGPLVVLLPDEEKVGQPVSLAERNYHGWQKLFE